MHPYENYDLREDDPYLIPGSECLQNLVGVTNTSALNIVERKITATMLTSLQHAPIPPTFDLPHLCNIHRRLFGRIYPFAGRVRRVEIAKGGRLFLPHALIVPVANRTFKELHEEDLLRSLTKEKFCERLGYYFGTINLIHPFREGNGRTQRVLLDQIAKECGFGIRWSAMSSHAIAEASAAVLAGDKDGKALAKLVSLHLFEI